MNLIAWGLYLDFLADGWELRWRSGNLMWYKPGHLVTARGCRGFQFLLKYNTVTAEL